MKKFAVILSAVLFGCFSAYALKYKVLERSEKPVPEWLGSQPVDALIVEVEAPDMSKARDKAIEEISKRIVMAVAANVVHNTVSSAEVSNVNGKLTETENFSYDTRIASARIPFIQGISLTEAENTYWEKCREEKSDRIFYRYAVMYPFSRAKLAGLREDFEKTDNEKNSRLEALKNGIRSVSGVTELEQAVTELEGLSEYFFDDIRKKEAQGLQADYRGLYKGLTLEATKPAAGKFTLSLLLNGHPFEISGVPTLKSNCASRLQADPSGSSIIVTYDDIDCLGDEDNWIEVSLRLRDTRLSRKVYL